MPYSLHKKFKILRAISLVLVCSFLIEQLSFGAEEIKPLSLSKEQALSLPFDLPSSIASIEDSYQAPLGSKTIYLIQDAHTNTSGQINLAKTLDLLLKNQPINHVFIEAGFQDESLSFLKQYGTKQKRNQIAERYLKRGDLQGEEYLSITSDKDFILWGVEDPELYKQSLENYRKVAKQRTKYQDYLNRIEQTVKVLKSKLYNPLLLSLDESHTQYQKGNLSITQYLKKLTANQDLKDYPHLKNLKKLQRLEQVLERQKQRYPKLSIVNHYKKLSSNLQAKQVLQKLKALEKQAFESLITTQDEKQLFNASKTTDYLKKLLTLTLTPEEFKEHPSLTSLTGFLNKKIMDLKQYYENALFLEEGFEDVIHSSEEFYTLTLQRDQYFIDQALQKMNQKGQSKAVLITGGYHTPNLKKLLKEKNISYAVFTPTITHETNQKRYEKSLLSQNPQTIFSSPEKLRRLAPASFSNLDIAHRMLGARLGIESQSNEIIWSFEKGPAAQGSRLSTGPSKSNFFPLLLVILPIAPTLLFLKKAVEYQNIGAQITGLALMLTAFFAVLFLSEIPKLPVKTSEGFRARWKDETKREILTLWTSAKASALWSISFAFLAALSFLSKGESRLANSFSVFEPLLTWAFLGLSVCFATSDLKAMKKINRGREAGHQEKQIWLRRLRDRFEEQLDLNKKKSGRISPEHLSLQSHWVDLFQFSEKLFLRSEMENYVLGLPLRVLRASKDQLSEKKFKSPLHREEAVIKQAIKELDKLIENPDMDDVLGARFSEENQKVSKLFKFFSSEQMSLIESKKIDFKEHLFETALSKIDVLGNGEISLLFKYLNPSSGVNEKMAKWIFKNQLRAFWRIQKYFGTNKPDDGYYGIESLMPGFLYKFKEEPGFLMPKVDIKNAHTLFFDGQPYEESILPNKRFRSLEHYLQIAQGMIDAVWWFHWLGLIHCDINPKNFLIHESTPPKVTLLDFGLSIPTDSPVSGLHWGTPGYVSPNQLLRKKLSGRDDIFSLSATLAWLWVGDKSFMDSQKADFIYSRNLFGFDISKNFQRMIRNNPLQSMILRGLANPGTEPYRLVFEMREEIGQIMGSRLAKYSAGSGKKNVARFPITPKTKWRREWSRWMPREWVEEFTSFPRPHPDSVRVVEKLRAFPADERVGRLEKSLGNEPENVVLMNALALAYLEKQDYEAAKEEAGRSLEVIRSLPRMFKEGKRQNTVIALDILGRALLAQGDFRRALKIFEKILKLNPGDGRAASFMEGPHLAEAGAAKSLQELKELVGVYDYIKNDYRVPEDEEEFHQLQNEIDSNGFSLNNLLVLDRLLQKKKKEYDELLVELKQVNPDPKLYRPGNIASIQAQIGQALDESRRREEEFENLKQHYQPYRDETIFEFYTENNEGGRLADAVTFLLKTYDTQKKIGTIVLGNLKLEIRIDEKGRLIMHGLGEGPLVFENYKMAVWETRKETKFTIEVSLADLASGLKEKTAALDLFLAEHKGVLKKTPKVLVIDRGIYEQPLLFGAMKEIARLDASTHFLLPDFEGGKHGYFPKSSFWSKTKEDLPEYFKTPDTKYVTLSLPDSTAKAEGYRLYLGSLVENDSLDISTVLKLMLSETLIDHPGFYRQFIGFYEKALGGKVQDSQELWEVLIGRQASGDIVSKYRLYSEVLIKNARLYQHLLKEFSQMA